VYWLSAITYFLIGHVFLKTIEAIYLAGNTQKLLPPSVTGSYTVDVVKRLNRAKRSDRCQSYTVEVCGSLHFWSTVIPQFQEIHYDL